MGFTWQSKFWVKCPNARKEDELICFPIWMKWSLGLYPSDRSHFSQEIVLLDTSDREKIRSSRNRNYFERSSNYCIAKLFSSLPFQSRMHYYPLNPPKYCANASFAFNFHQACFPGKSQLLRFSFMKVSRSNYFYRVRWDQIQLYFKKALFRDRYGLQQILLSF